MPPAPCGNRQLELTATTHKMCVWLSAAHTKLVFTPLSPGMCVIAGRERSSCSGHPVWSPCADTSRLPHHRHLPPGSRQGIHLPDARWHLSACRCPAPCRAPARLPLPGPTAAGLQMLPGRAVPMGGTVLRAAPAMCGDSELREAIAALQLNCRVITAQLPWEPLPSWLFHAGRAGGGQAAQAGCWLAHIPAGVEQHPPQHGRDRRLLRYSQRLQRAWE